MQSTAFQKRLATLALDQHTRFSLMHEQDPPLAAQIKRFWTEIGLKFSSVDVPWSAVFVSWCVKQAGASKQQFRFAAAHSQFVFQAIKNLADPNAVFFGREVHKYAPKVGDILQNNRVANKKLDFAFAAKNQVYASHSAIVHEVGVDTKGRYLRTIGGNEGQSVGMREIRLDANGFVRNPTGLYISVIETLL